MRGPFAAYQTPSLGTKTPFSRAVEWGDLATFQGFMNDDQ